MTPRNSYVPDIPKERPDPHILDLVITLARHRVALLLFPLVIGGAFIGITFIQPFTFTSITRIYPPEQKGKFDFLGFLSGNGGAALSNMKMLENPMLDLYQNLLESRMLAEEAVKDPFISSYYSRFDTSKLGQAFMVHEALYPQSLVSGILMNTVSVETHWFPTDSEKDSARRLSAYLANHANALIDSIHRRHLTAASKRARVFLEAEYAERSAAVDSLRAQFEAFQQEFGAFAVPEQISASIKNLTELNIRLQETEIQLAALRSELTSSSAWTSPIVAELEELRSTLLNERDHATGDHTLALASIPAINLRYLDFKQRLKTEEVVLSYVHGRLEEQRLDEATNFPVVRVLESGLVPERKSSPKRLAMLLLGLTIGLVSAILYVALRNFLDEVRHDPGSFTRFRVLVHALRHGRRSRFAQEELTVVNP